MTSTINNLLDKLKVVHDYLNRQLEQQPNYQQLIAIVTDGIKQLNNQQIIIKIVSSSLESAENFKDIITKIFNSNIYLQLQIIQFKQDLELEIDNCYLFCLIYDPRRAISNLEKQLIEQATQNKIKQIIIFDLSFLGEENSSDLPILFVDREDAVCFAGAYPLASHFSKEMMEQLWSKALLLQNPQLEENINNFQNWIINNQNRVINKFFLSLSSQDNLKIIEQLVQTKLERSTQQIEQKFKNDIIHYFAREKKLNWRAIYQQKKRFLKGEKPNTFQQKLNRITQKFNKEQQQLFKTFKQSVNQSKIDLVNPFSSTSLIYQVQQAIEKSETLEVKENNQTYLYLTIKNQKYSQQLSTYVLNICQESLSKWFEKEKEKINNFYDGGLEQLLKQTENELEFLNELYPHSINLSLLSKPSFELNNFISIPVIKEISKTKLDYHYTQSPWFRLTVAVIIGLLIFAVTGRLFGFVILVFQFINLLTAQDAKTIRIKQQTKELKRIVDGKYQFLVRFLVDRAGQIFITALEDASQKYQTDLDAIAQATEEKFTEVKKTINRHKEVINQLKQDQAELEKLLLE